MKCLIGLERRVITEVSLAVKGVVFDLFHRWIPALIQRRAATIQANIVKLMIGKGRSGMAKGALALTDKKQQSTQGLLVEFGCKQVFAAIAQPLNELIKRRTV